MDMYRVALKLRLSAVNAIETNASLMKFENNCLKLRTFISLKNCKKVYTLGLLLFILSFDSKQQLVVYPP